MIKSKAEVMKDLAKVRRRKIMIQKKEVETDQYGDTTTAWVDWCSLWAEIRALWGRDFYAAVAVGEEQTVEFVVKYADFLNELKTDTHRLVFNGEVYDIKQVDSLKDDGMWVKIKALRRD